MTPDLIILIVLVALTWLIAGTMLTPEHPDSSSADCFSETGIAEMDPCS